MDYTSRDFVALSASAKDGWRCSASSTSSPLAHSVTLHLRSHPPAARDRPPELVHEMSESSARELHSVQNSDALTACMERRLSRAAPCCTWGTATLHALSPPS